MKGQSSVEYIFTYGFAIFALVMVTGLLLSSGVLTPTQVIGEECYFGTNFRCNSVVFNDAGETKLNVNMYNGFPYKVKIISLEASTSDGKKLGGISSPMEIESGDNNTYYLYLENTILQPGEVARFQGNLTYVSCAPELSENGECSSNKHTVSGTIVGRVFEE